MTADISYRIEGSYYEACNCDAICPCRQHNGVSTGLSTYGICDFILSWDIKKGQAGDVKLDGRQVCMAGSYSDDVKGRPWSVIIYLDQGADENQCDALANIFRGDFGGNILFTRKLSDVIAVRSAQIDLGHDPGKETIKIADMAGAEVVEKAIYDGTVTCGIPGHDHTGQENISSLRLNDGPFDWVYEERCGFATDFAYWS